jgi:hypothetical protein
MNAVKGLRANHGRVLAAALVGALALVYLAAGSARAAVPDACGLTTESKMARALGLAHAVKRTSVPAPPGNTSGALRIVCRVFAWRGPRPANDKRKREALLEGRLAWLGVQTWVTDRSPYAPTWQAHFDAELGAIRTASVELFLGRLHGKAFVPPRYGAEEAIAYRASTAKVTKVRALWWNRRDKSMIEMNVEEARGKPVLDSLERIASIIVQRFSTECVYPCEPPATG